MEIVDIWTLDNLEEDERLLPRHTKGMIRFMWPELAIALDELCRQEYLRRDEEAEHERE